MARPGALTAALAAVFLAATGAVSAQDNICNAGEAPDIIVGEIPDVVYRGTLGGISAFGFGTDSCNVGTCQANWFFDSPDHPVIGQNLFRLKDGRFEHIGQGWVKHGFAALDWITCSEDCLDAPEDEYLGVNCSDLYGAGLNAAQTLLGPKSEVHARTGIFAWPPTDLGTTGDAIYKRLQVRNADIDPAQNPGAAYFIEAQYVARDDALGGNQDNNTSYRPTHVVVQPDGTFRFVLDAGTVQETPGIFAWQAADPAVLISALDMLGRYYIASRVTDLGNGAWHYQYAVQNVNADGAAKLTVPINPAATVSNVSFHDVDYHSGEPYDLTDWPSTFNSTLGALTWGPATLDELTNALRWGTLYSFGFDCNLPPELGSVVLGQYFIEASPPSGATAPASADKAAVQTWVPRACDGDGICDPAENCDNCPSDCPGIGTTGFCGDGICDPTSGEDCLSCGQDCSGRQGGNPGARYCCGDGAGENPVDCSDPRCNSGSFVCASPCCGDHVCDLSEDSCNCRVDCGAPREIACADGEDDDCDQLVDCADDDCCTNPVCADGIDSDGDSVAECDCNDANGAVWARPGEALGVLLAHDNTTATSTITWSPPNAPGGTSPSYQVLRSLVPGNFVDATDCLALANPQLAVATDAISPAPGTTFHYLVRAKNACPGAAGIGPLGTSSAGAERAGRTCP